MQSFSFKANPADFRPFAAATLCFATISPVALAQQPAEQILQPVVVTAARTPQVSADVLSDTIVITEEDIARSGEISLVDLLQRQRGIEITRNGGRGSNASVFIRGTANNQNVVLVDGVRVGSATTGGASWSNIPLSQVERIEIVYGPMSSLYGADAVGGVVQIFTKRGEEGVRPHAAVTVGSHQTRAAEAGVAGATGPLRFALGAAHEEAEGFSHTKPGAFGYNPDADGYEQDSVNGRISLDLAEGHELALSVLRSRLESQYDSRPAADDRLVHHLDVYSVTLKNRLTDSWTSSLLAARSFDKTSNFTATTTRFNTDQAHVSWQHDFRLANKDLFQVVLERREEDVDSTTTALNRERATKSAALAYQLRRNAHLASFSVRHDDSSQFGGHTTGSVAYGYRITPDLRASASVGTSFRAPSFNELYFPGFGFAGNQPERGRNAEIGLTYETGDTHFTATYYRNRVTDLLVTALPCPVSPASFPWGCAYNVNKALLTGLTLGGSTRVGNLVYRANVDFQDPKDETTGRRLARRATSHGKLAVEYDTGAVLAGTELVFSNGRFENAANTVRLPGYGLLNLYANYEFARDWSVFGRWNNVLDKNYELVRNYATEGSAVFVGVRYTPK